jgi:hypothetical protein
MTTITLSERLQVNLVEGYKNKMLSDQEVVQLIELGFDLLNLKTIPQAAKDLGKSYNGILKHHPKIINIKKMKMVIDNK